MRPLWSPARLALLLPACGHDEPPEVEVPSWAHVAPEQIAEAKKHGVPVAFENDLGMRFVLIPAGTFLMGSPEDEEGRSDGETQHEVTIHEAVLHVDLRGDERAVLAVRTGAREWRGIGHLARRHAADRRYEFRGVMRGLARPGYPGDPESPVPTRSRRKTAGSTPAVPGPPPATRGETTLRWHASSTTVSIPRRRSCWAATGPRSRRTTVTGLRLLSAPTAQTRGACMTCTATWQSGARTRLNSTRPSPIDPTKRRTVEGRVVRGGCWRWSPNLLRSAHRGPWNPNHGNAYFGFRLVSPLPEPGE